MSKKYRVLASVGCAAAIAFAHPVTYLAQTVAKETGKAAGILAAARKAIGGGKLDSLKTLAVASDVQRNVGSIQVKADVDVYVELPDKYAQALTMSGGPGMMIAGGGTTGFNGDQPLKKPGGGAVPGGAMVIQMSPGGSFTGGGEKPRPEQLAEMSKAAVRASKIEASRLMLGWLAMAHPAANAEYVYAGEAESIEGKAYVIDVKNADGLAARLFVDEQTNLPLMVTYRGPRPRVINQSFSAGGGHVVSQGDVAKQLQDLQKQEPQMTDYTLYFEDWREADGVKFPFKMRRAMGDTTTEEWSISKVRVNSRIDPKKFAVDNGG